MANAELMNQHDVFSSETFAFMLCQCHENSWLKLPMLRFNQNGNELRRKQTFIYSEMIFPLFSACHHSNTQLEKRYLC